MKLLGRLQFLFALVLSPLLAQAQAPCPPPDSCMWMQYSTYENMIIAPPCTLRVAFSILICNGQLDCSVIAIDAVQYLGTGCNPPPLTPDPYDIIVQSLLTDAPLPLDTCQKIPQDSCDWSITVRFSTCFARCNDVPFMQGPVDLPCPTGTCCIQNWRVCYENGRRRVQKFGRQLSQCQPGSTYNCDPNPECRVVCN